MENLDLGKFRDDLAASLREVRETDPEQARKILDALKETDIYKLAKKEHEVLALDKTEKDKKESIGKDLELHRSNVQKLESLTGKELMDEKDIVIAMGTISPEKIDREIYILEEKINAGMKPKEELFEEFKTRLKNLTV